MNQARLGVISGEIADQSEVYVCGFDLGTREARFPIPRKPFNLLDIPWPTAHFGLPSCLALVGTIHVGDWGGRKNTRGRSKGGTRRRARNQLMAAETPTPQKREGS